MVANRNHAGWPMVTVCQRFAQKTYPILLYICRGKEHEVECCAKRVADTRASAKTAKSKHKKLQMVSEVVVVVVWTGHQLCFAF